MITPKRMTITCFMSSMKTRLRFSEGKGQISDKYEINLTYLDALGLTKVQRLRIVFWFSFDIFKWRGRGRLKSKHFEVLKKFLAGVQKYRGRVTQRESRLNSKCLNRNWFFFQTASLSKKDILFRVVCNRLNTTRYVLKVKKASKYKTTLFTFWHIIIIL